MNSMMNALLCATVLAFTAACQADEGAGGAENCQLGQNDDPNKIVGTCCEPVNAAGQPVLNSAGQPLQGVCNGRNLCQFGTNATQVARGEACGEPSNGGGNGDVDSGPSIDLDDMGVIGAGGQGGGGGEANGGQVGPGGAGGESGGSGGGVGPGGSGGGGTGGGVGDPCEDVRCPDGAECNPDTGRCVPVGGGDAHGGPCESVDDCPPGDECLTEADSEGRVPGGFCLVNCRSDNDCGDAGRCLPSGQNNICFASCDGECRAGWTCIDVGDGGVCQPDCRVAGCGVGEVCSDETGLCDLGCPYACAGGEECQGGHCVRLNGTCVTDYHCAVNTQLCHEGTCVANPGTDCTDDASICGDSQICFDNAPNGNLCIFGCQADDNCPVNQLCYPDINVCWYSFCGDPENPAGANGEVFGQCATGAQGQWAGTCFPLPVGDPAGGSQPGICLEAGQVQEGQACNGQEEGRDAQSRAAQCAPTLLCFGDPDDGLDPAQDWGATGECAQLCEPPRGACSAGRTCVDFTNADDPNTPDYDETRPLGICLVSDCTLGTGGDSGCGAGDQCRPFSLGAAQGECSPAGNVAAGAACESTNDCADESFCGDTGSGPVCLPTCNADSPACPDGTMCTSNDDWGFSICL